MPVARQTAFQVRRVLIAEDSSATQDLLKLLLSQRGHEVDIVSDGQSALEKLRTQTYNVALLDFHLPKLTGLEIAKAFLAERGSAPRPRLIAMTADVEGLLADTDNYDQFDEVVSKPLDIYAIVRLIEAEAPSARVAGPVQASPDASGRPARRSTQQTEDAIEALGYAFLHWPDDFDPKRLAARNLQSEIADRRLDAVLVKGRARPETLGAIWRFNPLHLLPIIDVTGQSGRCVDINANGLTYGDAQKIGALIGEFHERRAQIHPDFWQTNDLGDKLLAYIAAKGNVLPVSYAPDCRSLVRHEAPLDEETLVREADKLSQSGFLTANFF